MDIVYRLISIDRHKNTYGSDKLKCALPVFGDATHTIARMMKKKIYDYEVINFTSRCVC